MGKVIGSSCRLPPGSTVETWVAEDENIVRCHVTEMVLTIEFPAADKVTVLKRLRAMIYNIERG